MIVKCLVHMTVEQSFPLYGIVFYVGAGARIFCLDLLFESSPIYG